MLFMGFEGMEERKYHEEKVQIKLILILAYKLISTS
jgi:hypothetical protein